MLDSTPAFSQLRKAFRELDKLTYGKSWLEDGFVSHAKAWAEEQSISLSAFQQMQVPDEVLRKAGFDLPAPGRRGRAKAVPVEEIKAHVLGREGIFLLTDITNGVGGNPATVRKAVDELTEAGQVEKLGPVQDWSGRGRAPILGMILPCC